MGTLFGVSDNYSRIRMDLVVNTLSAKAFFEKKMSVFGGEQYRPLLHVKDVARAFLYFDKKSSKNINNQVFNIGDNKNNITLYQLSCKIFKVLKIKKNIEWYGESDDRSYYVSFKKLNKLGHKSIYDINYGINDLSRNYISNKLLRENDSINMLWLDYLEKLNKSKNLTAKEKKILRLRQKFNGILKIK